MNTTIKTKGGEEKTSFITGAQRGTDKDKPRFEDPGLMSMGYNLDLGTRHYMFNGTPFTISNADEPIVGKVPYQEMDTSMIPDIMLNRLGGLFWRGAQKYSRDNWKKGMNLARTFSSMFRHMIYWWAGDTSEDHLAAVIWNATVLMWTENEIAEGRLPKELADSGPMRGYNDRH